MKKSTLLVNSLALIGNRIVQSLTSFLVLTLIARTLGPFALGQYTLAFSYYFVFMTLFSSGFKTLFTRELSRKNSEISAYLVSGTFLQLLFSLIGYALMGLIIFLMPYSNSTANICYVMGLAIIPFSLSNVIEAIFQAQEKMHLIAICTIPIYILRTLIIVYSLSLGHSIVIVSAIFVISETAIFLLESILIQKLFTFRWKIDKEFIFKMIKLVRTFLAIDGISIFRGKLQIFILSVLGNESTIGLYGAVEQLMQPFAIVSDSIVLAAFPRMSKMSLLESSKKRGLAEKSIEIMNFLALPIFIGFLFFSKDLLLFIYKDPSFAQASIALCIVSFGMIARGLNQTLGYTLVANHHEKINLIEVLVGTVIACIASFLLINKFQLQGAAISAIVVQIFASFIYIYATHTKLFTLRFSQIYSRPILVSILMLVFFLILKSVNISFFTTLIISTLFYCCISSPFALQFFGYSNKNIPKFLRK